MNEKNEIDNQEKQFTECSTLASDRRFRKLVENLMIGIIVHDNNKKIIFSNQEASNIIGSSIEDMQGKDAGDPSWSLIREDGSMIPLAEYPVNQVCTSKKILQSQVIGVRRPDRDSPIWVLCSAFPEFSDDGRLCQVVVNFTNITARLQLEKELAISKAVAEKALREKSRFLDIAIHELRTPVTSFSLIIQLAEKHLAKGYPVEANTIERLRLQAERITRLVLDLLDVSRLERGTLTLQLELKDISSLIIECIDDFKIREPKHPIIFLKPEGVITDVKIDSLRIYQVLTNFLDNAIKYTPENSPIEIKLEFISKIVRVSISDYGPGIADEEQKLLFLPFTRGAKTEKSSGLGLGLFICHEIIKLHGGKVGVKSKLGVGSTFFFELSLEGGPL